MGECRFELCHWSLFQIQREFAIALPWHFTQSLFDMDKQLFFPHEIFHIRIFRSLSVSQRAGMDICVLSAHPFRPPKAKSTRRKKRGQNARKKGGGVELLAAWWVLGTSWALAQDFSLLSTGGPISSLLLRPPPPPPPLSCCFLAR